MITRRGSVCRIPLDRWFISTLMLGLMLCAQQVGARTSIDLSGPWQYQISSSLTYPPSTNWSGTTVPGYLSSTNYARAWFRKEFTLPALPANHRVKLKFGGVKYNSTVYINGHAIGGCYNGYDSFELDATAFALTGVPNELLIAVGDWTTYFSSPVTFTNMSSGESVRDQAVNVVLAPIGGHFNLFGIWEPVSVEYAPQVAIANIRIATSVRNQRL
ncbi:MAG: sugar-binding domain-containing protein, partial [Verrucomicrobiota bacterium]